MNGDVITFANSEPESAVCMTYDTGNDDVALGVKRSGRYKPQLVQGADGIDFNYY